MTLSTLLLALQLNLFGLAIDHSDAILDKKITMTVHPSEILESVVFRLQSNSGEKIDYNTYLLLPHKAKAKDYREVSLRSILDEQLQGTGFTYRMVKGRLSICKAIVSDTTERRR
jgi:hypothetical protein